MLFIYTSLHEQITILIIENFRKTAYFIRVYLCMNVIKVSTINSLSYDDCSIRVYRSFTTTAMHIYAYKYCY